MVDVGCRVITVDGRTAQPELVDLVDCRPGLAQPTLPWNQPAVVSLAVVCRHRGPEVAAARLAAVGRLAAGVS